MQNVTKSEVYRIGYYGVEEPLKSGQVAQRALE